MTGRVAKLSQWGTSRFGRNFTAREKPRFALMNRDAPSPPMGEKVPDLSRRTSGRHETAANSEQGAKRRRAAFAVSAGLWSAPTSDVGALHDAGAHRGRSAAFMPQKRGNGISGSDFSRAIGKQTFLRPEDRVPCFGANSRSESGLSGVVARRHSTSIPSTGQISHSP